MLESQPDLMVVADVGDIPEALQSAREHQPSIVLLDLHIPGPTTLESIPRFVEAAPGCFVLVLTMEKEPAVARSALAAGANGYVLKDAAESELIDAVRAVIAGRTYLDPSLGAALAKTFERNAASGMPEPASLVGSTLAGHRIDALRGRGGMGVVFRATDLKLKRTVALKLVAPEAAINPEFRIRFERECRLAASIDHPHAVEIFRAGEEGHVLYLTMRYVDGPDLLAVLRAEGHLEPTRAVTLLAQIAGALDCAHFHGLVHRDVKPANVLIEHEHAFLTDFGLD